MNTRYPSKVIVALITSIIAMSALSLNAQKASTRLQVDFFKDHNKTERLVATLKIRQEAYEPLSNAEIAFYTVNDTSKVLLDNVMTDADGKAVFVVRDENDIFKNDMGMMTFEVEYAGDAETKGATKDIEVKPMDLKLSFFQEDSAKYISVEAAEVDADGNLTPVAGQEIGLYVKGLFSLLSLSKETTDENGMVKVEFPVDMPGDTLGVLTIVARVEESDTYGNVQAHGNINWAQPVPLPVLPHRGLGDTDAPLWMVYTLIVLLSAVWFHYLYVVYLIVKIKKAKNSIKSIA